MIATVALSASAAAATNVALGKPVTANSYFSSQIPSNVVDGSIDGVPPPIWSAGDHATLADPNWLVIDLGNAYQLEAIRIHGSDTDNPNWDLFSVDFSLYAGSDSVAWSFIGSGELIDPPGVAPLSPLRVQDFSIGAGRYRYIWFHATGGEHWTTVNEIEAFGIDPTAAPTPGQSATGPRLLGLPWPNPTAGPIHFSLELPAAASVRLRVVDVRGRQVFASRQEPRRAGYHQLWWSGRDSGGRTVEAGFYLGIVEVGGSMLASRGFIIRG